MVTVRVIHRGAFIYYSDEGTLAKVDKIRKSTGAVTVFGEATTKEKEIQKAQTKKKTNLTLDEQFSTPTRSTDQHRSSSLSYYSPRTLSMSGNRRAMEKSDLKKFIASEADPLDGLRFGLWSE